MLDNGYSLARVEIFNWGNFHGLQTFDLRNPEDAGPLLSPLSAAAILGTNGSGKSTLIDGLMMALLPFENSLKLGVTNDLESGGAGGRTVRDYVLGKYSSTGDQKNENLAQTYGRQNGCSLFMLVFRHNRMPDKYVTVGRIWWYQSYKIQDNQLAFISYSPIGVKDLCPNQQTPRNPKSLKEYVRQHLPQLILHETMQSYFMALSSALGQISKDDLKILNRAFYVKSISQIDSFIRENMLLEKDSPHLDRLLENVRNGKEIAYSIQICEEKIAAISKFLKDVEHVLNFEKARIELFIQKKLLSVYPAWNDLNTSYQQLVNLEAEISKLDLIRPEIQTSLDQCRRDHHSLQSQLLQNNVEFRIREINHEIEILSEKILRLKEQHDRCLQLVHGCGLKIPNHVEDWERFIEKRDQALSLFSTNLVENNIQIEKRRETKYKLTLDAEILKKELDHLGTTPTLLPRELCQLKNEAIQDLGIDPQHLKFVGELIQVRADYQVNRRAIESVLFPISRNLLCHPEDLAALTKWINSKGLRSDLTVKRIRSEELVAATDDLIKTFKPHSGSNAILTMLDMLPESEHPFKNYIRRWLADVFDYKIVDVARFKAQQEGKLVTVDGLVKTDQRTMRKLKKNFSFSLGWDNRDHIEVMVAELTRLNQNYDRETAEIDKRQLEIRKLELQIENLKALTKITPDFLLLRDHQQRRDLIQAECKKIELENPSYQRLKDQFAEMDLKLHQCMAKLSENQNLIKIKTDLRTKIAKHLPLQEQDLKESPAFGHLLRHFENEIKLNAELTQLADQIKRSNRTHFKIDAEIDEKLNLLEIKKTQHLTKAAADLQNYRRTYNDPDLPYDLNATAISEFQIEWNRALERLEVSELPKVKEKWKKFFDQVLLDSVKDTINEIKSKIHEIKSSIQSINEVLKLTNFEDLPTEQRYLQIDMQSSIDDRIRKFRRQTEEIEKLLGTTFRTQAESTSNEIMQTLFPFVDSLQSDTSYRSVVTDVRNYFQFRVFSFRRMLDTDDILVEVFTGSRKDAKSSAQTTQLAYTLLASCLAYRFKFHDPILGQDTPRLIVLDEFGGKFDNEKPRDILKLLDKMGFQSILVSPMSKGDLLAENICQLVLVHKVSASHSKTKSYPINSRKDYEQLINQGRIPLIKAHQNVDQKMTLTKTSGEVVMNGASL